MKKEYMKVLINENVVPDVGASRQITSLDWFIDESRTIPRSDRGTVAGINFIRLIESCRHLDERSAL